jgi:hypothetical protein
MRLYLALLRRDEEDTGGSNWAATAESTVEVDEWLVTERDGMATTDLKEEVVEESVAAVVVIDTGRLFLSTTLLDPTGIPSSMSSSSPSSPPSSTSGDESYELSSCVMLKRMASI